MDAVQDGKQGARDEKGSVAEREAVTHDCAETLAVVYDDVDEEVDTVQEVSNGV